MNLPMNLNRSQMQAVRQTEGPLMVLAGPGSGKTTVITYRAFQLAQEDKRPLVITFSKAAATEMEHRFRTLAGSQQGVTFGTFHGIFFRILRRRYGFNVDQVLQEPQKREIINKLMSDLGIKADEDVLIAIYNEMTLVKNELYDLQHFNSTAIGADSFRQLFTLYEEAKRKQNKIDFDDMLLLCYHLWQNEPENLAYWQKHFPYIMIDEFQDINHVQYECMKMLSKDPFHLCIVGDDDQSICRFRGARPEFLLQFPKDYPAVKQVVLDTNYRSTDPIIAFSNKLISQNQIRYDKVIVGTKRKGPTPKILKCNDQNQEAAHIAGKIKKHPNYNEVAVIYRVNIQARAFMDAFMQANIPFVVKDEASSIYEHWIAKDIFAYLQGDMAYIINKPFRYISKAFLQKAQDDILHWYTISDMLNTGQQQKIEELAKHLQAIKKKSAADAVKFIRTKVGYDDYIRDYSAYRKVNPAGLYEIAAEIQEAASAHKKPEDFLDHVEEALENKNEITPETERVTLTTMHSAKGLEFDTVYIAGTIEGLIPHERSKTAAELEEERRLFYVGATRAREDLYISVIKKRHEKQVEPSRFIANFKRRG